MKITFLSSKIVKKITDIDSVECAKIYLKIGCILGSIKKSNQGNFKNLKLYIVHHRDSGICLFRAAQNIMNLELNFAQLYI